MMRSIIHSVCVIFISLFVSCTNRDKTDFKSTKVDFSEITHINQSDGRIVKLETTDNSLFTIYVISMCIKIPLWFIHATSCTHSHQPEIS